MTIGDTPVYSRRSRDEKVVGCGGVNEAYIIDTLTDTASAPITLSDAGSQAAVAVGREYYVSAGTFVDVMNLTDHRTTSIDIGTFVDGIMTLVNNKLYVSGNGSNIVGVINTFIA